MKKYFYTYDTKEQINICLKCKKSECTNCWEYKKLDKENDNVNR